MGILDYTGHLWTSIWRRERDSNPRYAINVYTLSRRAPSTTRPPLLFFPLLLYKYNNNASRCRERPLSPVHGLRGTSATAPCVALPPASLQSCTSMCIGIRTLDTLLTYTHFDCHGWRKCIKIVGNNLCPGVRLQPLGHLSVFNRFYLYN